MRYLLSFAILSLFGTLSLVADPLVSPAANPDPFPRESAAPSRSVGSPTGLTNSMEVLNEKTVLGNGDRISYRIVEERREPIILTVTDSGEMEVPYIGRVAATGKSCKQIAYELKPLLEREYFYKATVIVGIETLSSRSRGKVYVTGQVRTQGAFDIPADETLTVSKVILRAGGVADFGNKRKVRLFRQKADGSNPEVIIVDLGEILDKGKTEKDPVLQPEDRINVPSKVFNF